MTCTKAFEVDLVAFLADPRDERWAEFRAHYPACPGCAAEVRAWTELDLMLRLGESSRDAVHPSAEQLLGFEERPGSLRPSEKASIGEHLAKCRSCTDELATLRAFDFAQLQAAPAAPKKRKRWRLPIFDIDFRFRSVFLHPAFAYALVLVLLYPTVARWQVPDAWLGVHALRFPPPSQVALAPASEKPAKAAVGRPSSERIERRLIGEEEDKGNVGGTQVAAKGEVATSRTHDSSEGKQLAQPKRATAPREDRLALLEAPRATRKSEPPREVARREEPAHGPGAASEPAAPTPKGPQPASEQRPPEAEPGAAEVAKLEKAPQESVPPEQAAAMTRELAPGVASSSVRKESRPRASWRNHWGLASRGSDEVDAVVAFAPRRLVESADAISPPRSADQPNASEPTDRIAVTLLPDRRVDVPAQALESGLVLRFPAPRLDRETLDIAAPFLLTRPSAPAAMEVRLMDPAGHQAAYPARPSRGAGDHLEVQLPASAMTPGVYRLETSPVGVGRQEGAQVYEFSVGRP